MNEDEEMLGAETVSLLVGIADCAFYNSEGRRPRTPPLGEPGEIIFLTIIVHQLLHPSDADVVKDCHLPAARNSYGDLLAEIADLIVVPFRHDDRTIAAK